MADYFEPTVIQQIIPDEDVTPIERLILTRMFECERRDKGWYLFAEDRPSTCVCALREEIESALAATSDTRSAAFTSVSEHLTTIDPEAVEIELDLSATSWEFFLQDVVRRSKTLRYLTAVTAFTCSKMRADGFGGMAVVITADSIIGKSTNDFIEDVLAEARLEDSCDTSPETTTALDSADTP